MAKAAKRTVQRKPSMVALRRLADRLWEEAQRSGLREDRVIAEAVAGACVYESRRGQGAGSKAFADAVHKYHATIDRLEVDKADERVTPPPLLPGSEWWRQLRDRAAALIKILPLDASVRPIVAQTLTLDAGTLVPGLEPERQPAAQANLAERLRVMPSDAAELARWTLYAFGKDRDFVNAADQSERKARSRAIARRKRRPPASK